MLAAMDSENTITRLYPRLVVDDAAAAIDFYLAAFGAVELERYALPDGKVVHAAVRIGTAYVTLKDADHVDPSARQLDGTPVLIGLDVTDADAVADAFVAAGGSALFPVEDREYGARAGRFMDPFGHLWMISQPIEDLTPDEIRQRVEG